MDFLAVNLAAQFSVSGIAWLAVSIHRSFAISSLIGNSNFTFIALTAGIILYYIYMFAAVFI